jgi:hypothetical protein
MEFMMVSPCYVLGCIRYLLYLSCISLRWFNSVSFLRRYSLKNLET